MSGLDGLVIASPLFLIAWELRALRRTLKPAREKAKKYRTHEEAEVIREHIDKTIERAQRFERIQGGAR